jgi:hypothetical protein
MVDQVDQVYRLSHPLRLWWVGAYKVSPFRGWWSLAGSIYAGICP